MSLKQPDIRGYRYADAETNASHRYLLPGLVAELARTGLRGAARRLFDLGCGNGSVSRALHDQGWDVTGVDPSSDGIRQAKTAHPGLRLEEGSAYDNLAHRYGTFPVVVSLEVVEHLYDPRLFAETAFELLEPGGRLILSKPYHGYTKNLAIAVTGGFDKHFTALWDHGHIKFWSPTTLGALLVETGFKIQGMKRLGRIPPIAKSMMMVAERPGC